MLSNVPKILQKASCAAALAGGVLMASTAAPLAETRFSVSIGANSASYLGRRAFDGSFGFDGLAFNAGLRQGPIELDLTIGQEQRDPEATLALFDAGLRFGNGAWKVGVGKRQRHWSPSRYNSLILSGNAQAFPAVYLAKTQATQSASPLLSWLGPWRGEVFIGQTSDVNQPDGALIAGMQLAVQPARGLEVELTRVVQFGGEGQPGGLSALFGDTNEGANAAANQIAGVGVSYTLPSRRSRFYAQVIGEDEAGGLPSCLMYLAGVEAKGQMFGAPATVTLEAVDTRIDETRGGNCGPNTAYNNAIYPYVHRGTDLGAVIGSESRSLDLRARHEFAAWTLDWGVGSYTINDASDPDHRLSSVRASGAFLSMGAQTEMWGGTVSGKLVHQGFELDRAGLRRGLRVGLGFAKSF